MANGRRHGNRDTSSDRSAGARAIDLDPSAGGLHQGAQPPCCRLRRRTHGRDRPTAENPFESLPRWGAKIHTRIQGICPHATRPGMWQGLTPRTRQPLIESGRNLPTMIDGICRARVWAFCSSRFNRGILAARSAGDGPCAWRDGAPRRRPSPKLAKLPYPAAQLRFMDAQFRRDIHDREPARLDALHRLPLELMPENTGASCSPSDTPPLARKLIMGVPQTPATVRG